MSEFLQIYFVFILLSVTLTLLTIDVNYKYTDSPCLLTIHSMTVYNSTEQKDLTDPQSYSLIVI